jgi:tetratricopeptide (TPR) repeat protein
VAKQTKTKAPVKTAKAEVSQNLPTESITVFMENRYIPYLIIALLTFLIYSNSLWNGYAIDDTLVLTENKFTKKGIDGIGDIFTHDAFVGFFGEKGSKLVSGGRYRPLSIATLALEYEISRKVKGDNRDEINESNIIIGESDKYLAPMASHLINVILFIFCCLLLYEILKSAIPSKNPFYLSLSFLATVLFVVHPIHTEAVTNIKGRDEVMGLLFSLITLWTSLKYIKENKIYFLLLGMLSFVLGLLSKENTITFFAIIPLTLYFFTKTEVKQYIAILVSLIIPIGIYLLMRTSFTDVGITEDSPEILNNPFAYTNGSFELKYATVIYTFWLYIKLLLFPIHLTHDYYFNQIPYVKFSDFGFLFSLALNAALVIYALLQLRKKTIPSYAILFYFITFSIVSNLVFTVGILMNERFMFFSSIGFSILLAYLLLEAGRKLKLSSNVLLYIFIGITSLYSLKTFSRNFAWKDNFTLFMTDVEVSTESSKIHTSCGGDLTKMAEKEPDSLKSKELLKKSVYHLKRAIQIYPTHSNAWLLLGNALYKLDREPKEALAAYEKAKAYRVGGYYDAFYNIGCVQVENGMAEQSIPNFLSALEMKPDVFECKFNLAEAYAKSMKFDTAIYWYSEASKQRPNEALPYYKVGTIYGKQLGNLDQAIVYISKAKELAPKVVLYYEDLAVAYGLKGRVDDAINTSLECLKVDPNYAPAINNLIVSYRIKGDMNASLKYTQILNQLRQRQ